MEPLVHSHVRFVIPPGQEAVIARILDPPSGLAGGWVFVRAAIERERIEGHYRGVNGTRARVILAAQATAPPEWARSDKFAVGLATAAPRALARPLYRSLLAAVRAVEREFAWQEIPAGRTADPDATAAQEAEGEIDRHLEHTPFIDLDVSFDHQSAFAEAMALRQRFVPYQGDPSYGVSGWRGLALQALDGDPARAATTDEDAGIYQDQSRYLRTDIAALCPITMSLLERLLELESCRTVAFLMLDPGARITVHVDGDGPAVMRSLNVALNMPEGCRLVVDCNPDGGDNPYTRVVPFRPGSAFLMNVAKYHYAVNDSPTPRIHVVARGSLRVPTLRVLELARRQNRLAAGAELDAALASKRTALGRAATGLRPGLPPMSPYVSTLAETACARLRDVIGVGPALRRTRIGADAIGSDAWRAEIELRLPSGQSIGLDLHPAAADREVWFRSATFAVSHRGGGTQITSDPSDAAMLAEIRAHIEQLDPAPPADAAPAVGAFLDALAAYRPFLQTRDEDYRLLFPDAQGAVGILWFGFGCNQDCRMCWQDRSGAAPPDEMFDRWLEELCGAGVSSLIFSGGEPTLHPRLPHWLRRAGKAGIPVTLETNAIRFTEPAILDGLRAAGLESVVVSLHAANAAVSNDMTMAPGTFALTVAGIRAALAANLRVGVHCVVERRNAGGLEEHALFIARQLRVGDHRVAHVSYSFPIPYRRQALYAGAIVPLDELRPALSAAVRVLRADGIEARFLGMSGFPPCTVDEAASLTVDPPDVVTDDMRRGRVLLGPCATCGLRTGCLGLPQAYVEAHGARGLQPRPGVRS